LAYLAEPRPEAESDDPSDSWLGPDLEELVGRMLDGPFTDEDIADTTFFQTKFMRQLELPAVVSVCVSLSEDYDLPMLMCAPVDDIADTVNRLAPYAKGENPMGISFNVENMIRAAVLLQLTAQRLIGMLLREVEARFKRTEPEQGALVRSTAETLCARIEEVAQREGIDLGPARELTQDDASPVYEKDGQVNALRGRGLFRTGGASNPPRPHTLTARRNNCFV